jgi:hypothetical protein
MGVISITMGVISITMGVISNTMGVISITMGVISMHFGAFQWVFRGAGFSRQLPNSATPFYSSTTNQSIHLIHESHTFNKSAGRSFRQRSFNCVLSVFSKSSPRLYNIIVPLIGRNNCVPYLDWKSSVWLKCFKTQGQP